MKNICKNGAERRPVANRKGKRDATSVPEIPGIPSEILPAHVQCVKVTKTFFRERTSDQVILRLFPSSQAQQEPEATRGVVDVLLNRMDDDNRVAEDQRDEQRQSQKEQTIQMWLSTIHHYIRDHKQQKADAIVGILEHLMKQERAGLHLAARLLAKSADARQWWVEHLLKWTDAVAGNSDVMFQREAIMLLEYLNKSFGDVYPTLNIGLQRLEQLCPDATTSVPVVDTELQSVAERRKLRDLALEKADAEEAAIRKLLDRAQACLDALVPRLGEPRHESLHHHHEDEDDDSENVEWEEGNVEEDQPLVVPHEVAVENTLAAMASTNTLQEGRIEVEFGDAPQVMDLDERHMRRLGKVSKRLHDRLPNLSTWINALIQADSLVQVSNGSLIRMENTKIQKRKQILKRLTTLKQHVATVLASANRLGVDTNSTLADAPKPRVARRPAVVRNRSLADNLSRKRTVTCSGARSNNRIQIKYRKGSREV